MEQIKLIDNTIIHKEIEPGVINDHMLQQCIINDFPKGECGRLARLEPIKYDRILQIRLELLHILKIDHLWVLPNLTKLSLNFNKIDKIENLGMLTNLKELDLSFNHIEKIENLENLKKLEILTLFSNSIRKIENLDSLSNLIILSIGQNKIDTLNGIERLRFFPKLRSLNLQGNPIDLNSKYSLRIYIAAFLPNLKYYEYIYIKEDERISGKEKYLRELRELYENEKDEIALIEKLTKEKSDEIRLSESFVELLNEHQLFDSLFENDEDSRILFLIGEEAKELATEYRLEAFNITQKIYHLGLEKHEKRLNEISLFKQCVDDGRIVVQLEGQIIVDELLEKKIIIYEKTREYLTFIETETNNTLGDDPSEQLIEMSEKFLALSIEFNEMIDKYWHILMEMEINLFESVEESNSAFGHVITDMINELIEHVQALFVTLRDSECNFCDNLQEAVTRYITFKMASKDEDSVPTELKECLEDKDAIMNFIAGMRDYHMQKIDIREDKLISRARKWVTELTTNLHTDEIKRNRNKVTEINYFLDYCRDEFDRLQEKIREDVLKNDDDE